MNNGRNAHLIDRHIFLTGFMGAGKTTVGQILAGQLAFHFYDSDDFIVARAQKTIPEIFATLGEKGFRDLETTALEELTVLPPAVIALGGGATVRTYNRTLLNKSGISVYLQWQPDKLVDRIFNDQNRPLVSGQEAVKRRVELIKLYESRMPLYEQADLVIPCESGMRPDEIAETILQKMLRLQR